MNENERAARLVGWQECKDARCEWPGLWLNLMGGHSKPPDYVGDIAEATTLIPENGTVRIARNMMGTWSCIFSGEPGERGFGITLSAAIVDAFIATKGGK